MKPNSITKWMNFEESLFDSQLNVRSKTELNKRFKNNADLLLKKQSCSWMQFLDNYRLSDKAKKNRDDLISGKAVAVITGQQPCLLTGPSLVMHKTFTAVSLCNHLNSIGIRAVPVFWNASEDHDLSEILRTTFITINNQLDQIRLHASLDKISAESISWSKDLEEFIQSRPPFAKEISDNGPKKMYSEHFNSLMLNLFADDGLLVVEPHWFNDDSKNFWEGVDEKKDDIISSFIKDEKRIIEENKVLQVFRRNAIPVFKIDKKSGRRTPLKYESGQWSDGLIESTNLINFINSEQRLSPGALLRPAYAQNHLPILATVLGPAEMKYHHQNKSMFDVLELPRPLLFPRLGGTWVSEEIRKNCEVYGINISELIENGFVADETSNDEKIFSEKMVRELCDKIEANHPNLSKFDLTSITKQVKNRTNELSGIIERKLWKAEQKARGLSVGRMHKIMNMIKPKGKLQERSICAFSFIKDLGHFKKIQSEFNDCFDNKHRVYS